MQRLLCPVEAESCDKRPDQVWPGKEHLPEPRLVGQVPQKAESRVADRWIICDARGIRGDPAFPVPRRPDVRGR